MQQGLRLGATVSFRSFFLPGAGLDLPGFAVALARLQIPQPGGDISAALPFSRALLASPPSPGSRGMMLRALCPLWCLLALLWDPSSPPSLPQFPLDASQSIQFLLPGSTRCSGVAGGLIN